MVSYLLSRTTMLPEELLYEIVLYLCFNPEFIERQLPSFRHKYARSEILSLSMASRQLRRICLPFLFAYVEIHGVGNIGRLTAFCAVNEDFASSIRSV